MQSLVASTGNSLALVITSHLLYKILYKITDQDEGVGTVQRFVCVASSESYTSCTNRCDGLLMHKVSHAITWWIMITWSGFLERFGISPKILMEISRFKWRLQEIQGFNGDFNGDFKIYEISVKILKDFSRCVQNFWECRTPWLQ